jgi:dTDP-4-dehydrorhamnose 3,5-epimerase
MEFTDIGLGVIEILPRKLGDARGFFAETWQRERFLEAGFAQEWIQDNQSYSAETGVLRGLHFQLAPFAQDKLIRVLRGSIFDVAVDVRPGSQTFGQWASRVLSATGFSQLLIPKGFAHGFLTLEPDVEVFYKVSAPYAPTFERSITWNDPVVGIQWPLKTGQKPLLSQKDAAAPLLASIASELVSL